MVTMEQLDAARPAEWSAAADAWTACASAWDGQADEYRRRVLDHLEDWNGVAGWAAKLAAGRLMHRYDGDDFAIWMRDVSTILRDFSTQVAAAQEDLREAQATEPVDPTVASAFAASARQSQIDAAVEKATRADHETAQRLRALLQGQDWADLLSPAEAADLVRRAAAGDPGALAELQAHKAMFEDPYLAKQLLKELGAKGLTEVPGQLAERMHDLKQSAATTIRPRGPTGSCSPSSATRSRQAPTPPTRPGPTASSTRTSTS